MSLNVWTIRGCTCLELGPCACSRRQITKVLALCACRPMSRSICFHLGYAGTTSCNPLAPSSQAPRRLLVEKLNSLSGCGCHARRIDCMLFVEPREDSH